MIIVGKSYSRIHHRQIIPPDKCMKFFTAIILSQIVYVSHKNKKTLDAIILHQGRINPRCHLASVQKNPHRNTDISLTTDVCLTSAHLTPPSAGHITQFPTRGSHRLPLSFDGTSDFSLPHRFFCIVAPKNALVNTFYKKIKLHYYILYIFILDNLIIIM